MLVVQGDDGVYALLYGAKNEELQWRGEGGNEGERTKEDVRGVGGTGEGGASRLST